MTSNGVGYIALISVIIFLSGHATSQDCINVLPDPPRWTVDETDIAGYLLFNVTAPTSATWSLESSQLDAYLELNHTGDVLSLFLLQPLDLESLNQISYRVYAQCSSPSINNIRHEMYLHVISVNEYNPYFVGDPFHATIIENTPPSSVIFSMAGRVADDDYGTPTFRFATENYTDPVVDALQFVRLNSDITGEVIIRSTTHLDYEQLAKDGLTTLYLVLNVQDDTTSPRYNTTTITISVTDTDDQGPAFVHDCTCTTCPLIRPGKCEVMGYTSNIADAFTGNLPTLPAAVHAIDKDTLDYVIEYSFYSGTPANYANYLTIDSQTGEVTVIQSPLGATQFLIFIQATERSPSSHYDTIRLDITITSTAVTPSPSGSPSTLSPSAPSSSSSGHVTHELTTPIPDNTTITEEPPDIGLAVDGSGHGIIPLWALLVGIGAVIICAFIALGVLFVIMRKRHNKAISPLYDSSGTRGRGDGSNEPEILDAYATDPSKALPWDTHTPTQSSPVNSHDTLIVTDNGTIPMNYENPEALVVPKGKANKLEPLQRTETNNETVMDEPLRKKKRPRKRKDKSKDTEIFDGTKEYNMGADTSFFLDPKTKLKQSSRRKDTRTDPTHWITVPNDVKDD